jgi:hypothetical protein
MYAVVDASAPSPFVSHSPKGSTGLDWSANWGQVVQHMAQRLAWADERFNLQVCLWVAQCCVCIVHGRLCTVLVLSQQHWSLGGGHWSVVEHVDRERHPTQHAAVCVPYSLTHAPPS